MQKSVLLLLGALVALLRPTTGIRVVREAPRPVPVKLVASSVTLTAWPRRRARQPRTTKSWQPRRVPARRARITAVSTQFTAAHKFGDR